MALVDGDSATLLRKFNEARDNLRVCPHGCQARKCPQLLDASNFSYIRIWSEPAFAEDLTLAQAQPAFGLAPLAPAISRGFLAPSEPPALPLPIPFAAIISGRRIDGLAEYQTIFPSCDTCVFCFELRPIQGIVYKAVSLRCHGKEDMLWRLLMGVDQHDGTVNLRLQFSASFVFAIVYATQSLALPTGINADGELIERHYSAPTQPETYIIPSPPSNIYVPPASTYVPPVDTYVPPAKTYVPPAPPSSTYVPPVETYVPPVSTYTAPSPPTTYVPPASTHTTHTPPATTHTPPPPPKDDCSAVHKATFLQRAYSGGATDHFYTTNTNEMTNAVSHLGYTREAHAAKVYNSKEAGTIPLYRLFNASAGDHFYTTSAGERDNAARALGYKSEGVAAYIYQKQICGSVPLYRLYSPSATDHFYTISKSEADNAASKLGYAKEGVAGYVLPPH
ncbi:hypothetical protein EYR40_007446 [Pleurotus pulmonarius]|nr:hypothetical protein EYR40_007446 [Pleurotus pulmonarius]